MLSTIVIDDEPKAIEILTGFIQRVPFMELQETFRDPIDAIQHIQHHRSNLLLLDINMPNLSGMEFVKTLDYKPEIIFTTAHSKYAVESYEYGAVDYLLKPIKFDRFLKAVTRANNKLEGTDETNEHSSEKDQSPGTSIFVKSGPQTYKISTDDILYLEKDGNYLIFHTNAKKILSRQSMGDVFDILDKHEFVRIHKSYIVPLNKIDVIEKHQVKIGKKEIPIGRTFKDEFFEYLDIGDK